MPLECINPDDLPIPETYTQVVVATGNKLVFVSGQQPEDSQSLALLDAIMSPEWDYPSGAIEQ